MCVCGNKSAAVSSRTRRLRFEGREREEKTGKRKTETERKTERKKESLGAMPSNLLSGKPGLAD